VCFCVLTTALRRRYRAATFALHRAVLGRSSGGARPAALFDPARGVMAFGGIREQLATQRRQFVAGAPGCLARCLPPRARLSA